MDTCYVWLEAGQEVMPRSFERVSRTPHVPSYDSHWLVCLTCIDFSGKRSAVRWKPGLDGHARGQIHPLSLANKSQPAAGPRGEAAITDATTQR